MSHPSKPFSASSNPPLASVGGAEPHPSLTTPVASVMVHTPIRWQRIGWIGGILALMGFLVGLAAQVRGVTIPLLIAFTLAYVLDPWVSWFEKHRMKRTLTILILLTSFLALSGGVGLVLGPRIVQEVTQMPSKLQEVWRQVGPWAHTYLKVDLPQNVDSVLNSLQEELTGGSEGGMGAWARSIGSMLRTVFGGTVSVLASLGGLLMIPLFCFYMLRDFHRLTMWLQSLVPIPARAAVIASFKEIDATLSAFVRGQLMMGGILAVLYATGFTLVGLPLGLVVGITTGFGNMIPYVGTVFGLLAATLMALLDWQGWGHLALIYSVFVGCHVLESGVIGPRILGGSVGVSPFWVIVSVLVFGELFGFFGVLVAVPLAAVLKIVFRLALDYYRSSSFFTGFTSERTAISR